MTDPQAKALLQFGDSILVYFGSLTIIAMYIKKQNLTGVIDDEESKPDAPPQYRLLQKLLKMLNKKLKNFVKETKKRGKSFMAASNDKKAEFAAVRKKAVAYYDLFHQNRQLFRLIAEQMKKLGRQVDLLKIDRSIMIKKSRTMLKLMKAREQVVDSAHKALIATPL